MVKSIAVGLRYAIEYSLAFVEIPVMPRLISSAVALYFFTAEMRMLGLLYYAKRERLGWFK